MAKERKRVRKAFETYRLLEELSPMDWPEPPDLHQIADRLQLPYLMLLLDYWRRDSAPSQVTLADIAEWNAAELAQGSADRAVGGRRSGPCRAEVIS